MITKKKQQDYIRRRWASLLNHFERFAKRTDADHMHEIRVELKKLRALIFLQEESGNSIEKKEKALLKKLFRAAGKVREAQVTSQLVRNVKLNAKPVISAEREKVARYAKAFVKLMQSETDAIVLLNTRMWKKIKAVPRKKVEAIQRELMNDIRKAFKPALKPGKLHDSRKLIKKYVYSDSLKKKEGPEKELSAVTNRLKRLEAEIGKWHDIEATVEIIKPLKIGIPSLKRLRKISDKRLNTVKKAANKIF
jgi:CHAD domain-containing protein